MQMKYDENLCTCMYNKYSLKMQWIDYDAESKILFETNNVSGS